MKANVYYYPPAAVSLFTLRWLLLVLIYCPGSIALAQSTSTYTNWYFGDGAGIAFSGNSLQALTAGELQAKEGCAAISDANGQLLFYTDGRTIWNRMHEIMPGAVDLGGSTSSTQSALIVPYQNSTGRFFCVFRSR